MLECYELASDDNAAASLSVELNFEQRKKSRYKTTTYCGLGLGWFLPRGRVLQAGDILACSDGSKVLVVAAQEQVSEVVSDDPHLLMRGAYHLGNRHVPLQIDHGLLRYQHDHVLDQMLQGLGLTVQCCQRPFNPEMGAYHGTSGHGHSHDHDNEHSHEHSHEHDNSHEHSEAQVHSR